MNDPTMTTYLYLRGWRRLSENDEYSGQLVAHEDMQSDSVLGYMSYIKFEDIYIGNFYMTGMSYDGLFYRLYYNQEIRGYKS
jgi:hypothetical protein